MIGPSTQGFHRRTWIYKALTAGPLIRVLDKLTTKAATSIMLKDYPSPTHHDGRPSSAPAEMT